MPIVWDESFRSSRMGVEWMDDVHIESRLFGTKIHPKVQAFFTKEDLVGRITKYGFMHVGEDRERGRLYFDEDPLKKDRRVNRFVRAGQEYSYISLGYVKDFKDWVGDYPLLYDEKEELYYIERA